MGTYQQLSLNIGAAQKTQKTYLALKQPPYSPPGYVFGPVWTLLYGLMGYSAYRAWDVGQMANSTLTHELAKVMHCRKSTCIVHTAHVIAARGDVVYDTTRAQPDMDAALLWDE